MAPNAHRVLFLNSIAPDVWGGLENWMELCAVGLARRGHAVWVGGRRESEFLRRLAAHPEITVQPLDIAGDFDLRTARQIAAQVTGGGIDIILCNLVKDVRLAGMARLLSRPYKIIWTPGVNLAKKSLSHCWLFSRWVDRVIVPSNHLRDAMIPSGYIPASNFVVVPVGIDEIHWQGTRDEGRRFLEQRFGISPEAFVCLTSGRFVSQKGHKHLIDAARPLAAKYGNLRFLLLGDGPLRPQLEEQVRNAGLSDRFIFAGLLDDHRPAVFGADLYVHPAVIEPYGIVLVEAMAASLPIVATRVGGIPEVVVENETALLVEPADAAQLTTAIERFYTDASLQAAFGAAGHERYTRHFRLATMLDRMEQTLMDVVAG
jgi:glycosyltransferase involved in cell wall biosynthesis